MFIFSGKLFIKMASVHPEMYFNVEYKVTCLAFIKENQILIGTTSGKNQLWSLKSQSLTKTFDLFSDSEPILWIHVFEENVIVQARFSNILQILDINNLEEITAKIEISQGAVHFCKGDVKSDSMFAVPTGENGCEIIKNFKSENMIQAK